jgi:hypothetical protein
MSSTFSEIAATALAEALSAEPRTGRHLVASIHGEELLDTFRTLLSRTEHERTFQAGEGPEVTLRVLDNGDGCVIVPYLVQDPPPPNPRQNRGSQGFLSALRDIYSECAEPGERVMLLAFAASPNETVITAMTTTVTDTALQLQRLLELALEPRSDCSQALKRVCLELGRLAPKKLSGRLSPETIGLTAQAVKELALFEKTEDVAESLFQIPWLLGDPKLFSYSGREFQNRLEGAMDYREKIQEWADDPTEDFDGTVRQTFDAAAVPKLTSARIGPDINWADFTYEDLIAGAPSPDDGEPKFEPRPVEVKQATALKLLAGGKSVAVTVPSPEFGITFLLTERLRGNENIHLVAYTGKQAPYSAEIIGTCTSKDSIYGLHFADLPQPRPGWSFLRAVITKGKRLANPSDEVLLAVNIGGPDSTLVYEEQGLIDLNAQAFSGDEVLTFIAEKDGAELWTKAIEPPKEEFGDVTELPGGLYAPAVQADAEGDPDAEEEMAYSAEHLAIEQWTAGVLPPGPLEAFLRRRPNGVVVADVGPISRPVPDFKSTPTSRWELEQKIIETPRVTAFRLMPEGDLLERSEIEELELGHLRPQFEAFLEAREVFFRQLEAHPVPSLISANLHATTAAMEYVVSYEKLLAAVPDEQESHLGYDRLLLIDSVVTSSGGLLIAPTNPLSVAAHLDLQSKTAEWLQQKPHKNFFASDTDLITPRYLVPYLRLNQGSGQWLESGYAPYPWRSYLELADRSHQERHPSLHRYIAGRIERFLDVHPSYADERRTLQLAFVNSGNSSHIVESLLFLLKRRRNLLSKTPTFDLKLLSDDGLGGSDLDYFVGFAQEDRQPSDAELEVMKRLSYTKGVTNEFLEDPKSFAHITFLEDFFKPRKDLRQWPSEAHPSSMYVSGLASDTERLAKVDAGATRFLTATWTGGETDGRTTRIAARLTEISAAAAGVPVQRGIVRAAEVLIADSEIPRIYTRAAWVVHLDRQVGLELFAPQASGSGSPYILDYTDQETPEPGIYDGITATSEIRPYHAKIKNVLEDAIENIVVSESAAENLIRTLNLISGRWGLEMLRTSDNVLRGRLATALTAQVLEQSDGLHTDPMTLTLIVALDELLRVTGSEGLPTSEGWAAKSGTKGGASDDLLLLSVPLGAGRPKLSGRIIEVKFRSSAASASVDDAASQILATHKLLSAVLVSEDQPGREFQGRHLAKLILRYAGRHIAYGVRSGQPLTLSGTESLSRIAKGDYDLDLNIYRAGKTLYGDYVSVQPTDDDPSLIPQMTTAEGIDIGRIRIGKPVIAAILNTGSIPAASSSNTPVVSNDGASHDSSRRSDSTTKSKPSSEDVTSSTSNDSQPPKAEAAAHIAARFALPSDELRGIAGRLDDVLTNYNLPLQPVQPSDAVCGPNIIRFRVRMARGGTIAQVEARERDIQRELGLQREVMIGQEAGFVSFDLPRTDPVPVTFGDLLPSLRSFPRIRGQLPVMFGVDASGLPQIRDLAQLPHLLIAGRPGSGKSMFLSTLIGSLATLPSDSIEIALIDVKGLDFVRIGGLPHLRQPPIGNASEALQFLNELFEHERTRRREILTGAGAQGILDYYTRLNGTELTQIVIVIDEFSSLLSGDKAAGSQIEDIVQRYAEVMRSFGIYLVIATQRPSADIITGRIKANLPARCAFQLPTFNDSITILGRKGAEQLLGNGDMLFYTDGAIERLQAPLTTPDDILAFAHE